MTDHVSAEGLREALFDCYVLLPPERLDLLRDETKRTIDIAAALRDTSAEGLLSRDNPRSRWHAEQVTPDYRQSWSCIPLTDAVEAAALRDTGPRPDSGIDVDARDEVVRRAMLYVMQMSDAQLSAFAPVALIRALEQDGYTVARLSTPRTETSES